MFHALELLRECARQRFLASFGFLHIFLPQSDKLEVAHTQRVTMASGWVLFVGKLEGFLAFWLVLLVLHRTGNPGAAAQLRGGARPVPVDLRSSARRRRRSTSHRRHRWPRCALAHLITCWMWPVCRLWPPALRDSRVRTGPWPGGRWVAAMLSTRPPVMWSLYSAAVVLLWAGGSDGTAGRGYDRNLGGTGA